MGAKGVVTIVVEVDLTPTTNDSGLSCEEIADYAAGGICGTIKSQSHRSPKIKSCEIEYTNKIIVDA